MGCSTPIVLIVPGEHPGGDAQAGPHRYHIGCCDVGSRRAAPTHHNMSQLIPFTQRRTVHVPKKASSALQFSSWLGTPAVHVCPTGRVPAPGPVNWRPTGPSTGPEATERDQVARGGRGCCLLHVYLSLCLHGVPGQSLLTWSSGSWFCASPFISLLDYT